VCVEREGGGGGEREISRDKNDFIKIQQVDRKFRSKNGDSVTLNVVT